MVITESVIHDIRSDVLPGNYHEEIEIDPPDQNEREIQIANVKIHVITPVVRPQSQGPHHRDGMKKQDHIAQERIRDSLPADDLEVGPNHLADQPCATTERQ